MQLTATTRSADRGFTLTAEEMSEGEVGIRVNARKGIALHASGGQKELAGEVAARALDFRESGAAVLVFLRRVADVKAVAGTLEKSGCEVQRLTGTLRGRERDALVRDSEILRRFLRPGGKDGTVYLVSTSAGEVGVDLSADHAVCDLTPFDSMAQRLGRVNRFGKGDARVEVVHYPTPEKAAAFDERCERTLRLLGELPVREDGRLDASPAALGGLDAEKRAAAFSPEPEILLTSDILFDRWALTTIREAMPGRPPVADWLHGVEEGEAPQAFVAWREEVDRVSGTILSEPEFLEELLDAFPLKPHELMRESAARVVEEVEKIAERAPGAWLWRVDSDGSVDVTTAGDFVKGDKKKIARAVSDCTLLLPPLAGGLDKGFLAGDVPFSDGVLYDVSEQWLDERGRPQRARCLSDERPAGMRLVRTLDLRTGQEEEEDEQQDGRYWRWYVRPRAADDDGSRSAVGSQTLGWHCEQAVAYAARLATSLGLGEVEAEALRAAAAWHDRGKDRELWQRSIGNLEYPDQVLAKSRDRGWMKQASRYRHEFGSLLEMGQEVSDLALHMVAAHHGRARPHFPDEEAFDPKYADAVAERAAGEVPARFIRLQRQYGRWGLAYLESLLRAVDAWASQQQEEIAREAKA
jgi:CRISPR-associated endonuclease/helicase Cas3